MKSLDFSPLRGLLRMTVVSLLLFTLPSTQSFAQTYLEVKHKKEQYLDKLHETMPDSLFYHEGSEYNKFIQWDEFWKPRLSPNGDFDKYYQLQKVGLDELGARLLTIYPVDWQEIGPTDEPTGTIACNVSQSAGIGPVEFIRFYRQNPQHMLTASTKGGLFYSSNGGDQWANAGSDLWAGVAAVSWAEFKVDDPEVAFAASGEPDDNHAGPINWTGGIYRAQKNGPINPNTQWDLIASVSNCFNGQTNCRINKILTDPFDPDVLYVATTWGLFKSSNVNAAVPTWQNMLQDNIWDVEMRPGVGNHLTLYVSFDGNPNSPNPSPNSNLVKFSTDGGISWNLLANSPSLLPVNNISSNIRSVSIEVSESTGLQQNIYLLYYGTSAQYKNMYRYDFSTASFVNILTNIDDISGGGFSNCCFGAGYAFGVSQSGPNEVIFLAYGDRYARLFNGALTLFGYSNPNVNEYHVDMEGFTFNPNNASEVWMASHGGPYKSINQGDNWAPKMKGVGVAMVFNMSTSYENPEDILISTYHDGDILTQGPYTPNWSPPWNYVFGCDGANVLIDNKDPNYMYASGQGHPWGRSTDGGATTPFPYIPFYQAGAWSNFSVELNKEETNILYGIQNDEVNRDMNHGSSSGTIISNLALKAGVNTNCSDVYNIFTFEHNKDLLFATFWNCTTADLYYTLNARNLAIDPVNDWYKVNLGNGNRVIVDVEIDPLNSDNIFVALSPDWGASSPSQIMKIENFKTLSPTITNLTYNLPWTNLGRECLLLEKASNGGMYLATDLGAVFYTNNSLIAAGASNAWVQFGSDYPHVTTNGLEINYKINKIRAAPYARGVWEADLYCPPGPYICSNCNITNGFFWEGTYVSVENTTLNSSNSNRAIMRGTEYVEILPGTGGFTLLDPSGNINNYYEAYIHGCTAAQGNTFKLQPPEEEESTEISAERATETGSEFTVFPNPNNGSFTLEFGVGGEKNIVIFDLSGKIVFQRRNIRETFHQIDLINLPKGIYVIQVTNSVNSVVKKIVVE